MVNIPLVYFETALTWLLAQPGVQTDGLVVIGNSRGGELALLLGATFPQVKDVVGYNPSDVIWEGVGKGVPAGAPAWSYQGRLMPVMPGRATPAQIEAIVRQTPISLTPLFLIDLEEPQTVEASRIPVEKIKGSVLLISGKDDEKRSHLLRRMLDLLHGSQEIGGHIILHAAGQ